MDRNRVQDYFDNPELYRRLAERERARAVGESFAWLAGSIRELASRIAGLLAPRHPARWTERLG